MDRASSDDVRQALSRVAQALDWLEARNQDASAKMMTVIKPRRALLSAAA